MNGEAGDRPATEAGGGFDGILAGLLLFSALAWAAFTFWVAFGVPRYVPAFEALGGAQQLPVPTKLIFRISYSPIGPVGMALVGLAGILAAWMARNRGLAVAWIVIPLLAWALAHNEAIVVPIKKLQQPLTVPRPPPRSPRPPAR